VPCCELLPELAPQSSIAVFDELVVPLLVEPLPLLEPALGTPLEALGELVLLLELGELVPDALLLPGPQSVPLRFMVLVVPLLVLLVLGIELAPPVLVWAKAAEPSVSATIEAAVRIPVLMRVPPCKSARAVPWPRRSLSQTSRRRRRFRCFAKLRRTRKRAAQ
jgi:hypothetical protein